MSMAQDNQELEWNANSAESPFAESMPEAEARRDESVGYSQFAEGLTPFEETVSGLATDSESDIRFSEAFTELRDESFDEALAYLTEETEQAVAERFTSETPGNAAERERFAESYLSPVRFEAQQYLDTLEQGLAGMDVESLSEQQLDEVLDRFDPEMGELTPAGEEFIGKLIRKAKNVVKSVVNTAKNVAGKVVSVVGKVASFALGPILKKLKGLINPLLKRVLQFAIGRLPAPLQPVARRLASRISLEAEAEDEGFDEGAASPANLTDVEMLAESFDAALAEAITSDATEMEGESYESLDSEADAGGRELELLAEARGELIERFRSAGDQEDLGPAVEQFIPALLGALRIGINLIGRPKVVGFLAKFVGRLISRWVGPQLSGPLSNAIVDTGLRLVMLENEGEASETRTDEVAPIALASVVEDTVRQLAENEDYVFENEDLLQLAASEAFNRAASTYFPPRYIRPAIQQATSLGGTFIARRPRAIRPYRKYNRVPEIEVTAQVADALPSFGGTSVGSVLRAAGAVFPMRARLHIYQSTTGTTLPRMIRMDRNGAGAGRGYFSSAGVHPLTPAAAGLLLREPQLGVSVPAAYLQSRHRIAAGQRFYLIEPLGAVGALALPTGSAARSAATRLAPSRAWTTINLRRGRITVGFYISESESQRLAEAIRQGRGAATLLQSLTGIFKSMERSATSPHGHIRIVREDHAESEDFSTGRLLPSGLAAMLRRKLRSWVFPALASWVRNNAEAFVRAANHPDAGVTIRVRLTGVPGLDVLRRVTLGAGMASLGGLLGALRGTPSIAITVTPGRGRK